VLIEIDPASPVPPYEQLRITITALVLREMLEPGAKLPSIRQLAGDLGLAPGTVARAYRELEADGVVRSRGARGTVVVGPPSKDTATSRLLGQATSLATAANETHVGIEDAIAALRIAFASLRAQP
jgi:GntR family transcriptional regulator